MMPDFGKLLLQVLVEVQMLLPPCTTEATYTLSKRDQY